MSGKPTPEDAAGHPWLEALEARVQDAVERLAALRAENRRLVERVAELEARLVAAEEGGGEAEGGAPAGVERPAAGEEAAAWRRERDEVRRRVGRLSETLQHLLADDGE